MFEHSHGGWKIEQTTVGNPHKVRAKVDDLTCWVERIEGAWVLSAVEYARRDGDKKPDQFRVLSNADQQLEVPGTKEIKLVAALRRYWEAWRASPGGLIERLEDVEKKIEATP